MGTFAKELGDFPFARLSLRNGEGQIHKPIFIGFDGHIIDCQKDDGNRRASPFVAVEEGVVLDDVIEIGSRHLVQVLVQELASERGLRHRDRRMQQAHIADSLRTTVSLNETVVRSQNVVQVQNRGSIAYSYSAKRFMARPKRL